MLVGSLHIVHTPVISFNTTPNLSVITWRLVQPTLHGIALLLAQCKILKCKFELANNNKNFLGLRKFDLN